MADATPVRRPKVNAISATATPNEALRRMNDAGVNWLVVASHGVVIGTVDRNGLARTIGTYPTLGHELMERDGEPGYQALWLDR